MPFYFILFIYVLVFKHFIFIYFFWGGANPINRPNGIWDKPPIQRLLLWDRETERDGGLGKNDTGMFETQLPGLRLVASKVLRRRSLPILSNDPEKSQGKQAGA